MVIEKKEKVPVPRFDDELKVKLLNYLKYIATGNISLNELLKKKRKKKKEIES